MNILEATICLELIKLGRYKKKFIVSKSVFYMVRQAHKHYYSNFPWRRFKKCLILLEEEGILGYTGKYAILDEDCA